MKLDNYIKAGYSVIMIQSAEETRVELNITKTATDLKRRIKVWSFSEGFFNPDGTGVESTYDPVEALNKLKSGEPNTIYVMRDLHMFLGNPKVVRLIRDIAREFKQHRKTMIMLSAVKKLTPEMERDVTVLEFDLPKTEELQFIWDSLFKEHGKKIGTTSPAEHEKIVQAALGLTTTEAESAFAKAIVEFVADNSTPISKLVMREKAAAVKRSGILEYCDTVQTMDDVGGLDNLKDWLRVRSKSFSKAARDFGLPMSKGILLVGIPGSGKSLVAKAASSILGAPLLKFDIGKVFGSLVGQSESQMRLALQTAEAVNNSVLFVDEMEKAFAGMGGSNSSGDSGTSQRVFGTFLTWMQEKTVPCFVIATVNRIDNLPPELLRKGRFDEIFYVGLPDAKSREDIFKIHLKRLTKDRVEFTSKELKECVKLSDGFSGAEIEESVISGMYAAFDAGKELTASDVYKALENTNPLSRTKADEIRQMSEWAENNAVNASKVEKKSKTTVRQLELSA